MASNQSSGPPSVGGGIDNLTCQWQGCTQPHHPSPEALYEHVCETHIGRKSTNNLNLQCYWGPCRTTTVKRDHITSHIRVHVPLKPHKCEFCGKSFKRPQDLKKHVKTHADESVLLNSPQTGPNGQRQTANGYPTQNSKSSGYYGDGGMGQNMSYGYPHPHGGHGHYAAGHGGIPAHNFGPVYYPQMTQGSSYGGIGLTESRKRTHDALNDFFGEVKRRQIDPHQYQDIGARFGDGLNMMTSAAPAFPTGYYDGNGVAVGYQSHHVPTIQPGYGMHFPELKTKNDLFTLDQFLEQLQQTIYENPVHTAASGFDSMQGAVHVDMNVQPRGSASPPRGQAGNTVQTPGALSSTSFAASSTVDDTPALTPASFARNQSPSSQQNRSPVMATMPSANLYPALPSFRSFDQTNQFAMGSPGGVPHQGLGNQYEDTDGRRRFSGGFLRAAQPSPPSHEARNSESPKSSSGSPTTKGATVKLPSVADITRRKAESDGSATEDEKQEAWINNMRTIEWLRHLIRSKIDKDDFEASDDGKATPRANSDVEMGDAERDPSDPQPDTPKRTGASLYPILRPVEA